MAALSSKSKSKNLREPPPSLFLGPPSHNASQISISKELPSNQSALPSVSNTITPQRIPLPASLQRQRSQITQTTTRSPLNQNTKHGSNPPLDSTTIENITSNISPPIPTLGLGKSLSSNVGAGTGEKDFGGISGPDIPNPLPLQPRPRHVSESQKQADRTDALWVEMQSTLEEVDLSASYNIAGNGGPGASSGGINVFGPEHGKVLEELRSAQMELAKAWARSEVADEEEERRGLDRNEKENPLSVGLGKSVGLKSVPSDAGRSHADQSHAEKDVSFTGKSTAQSGSASGPRMGEAGGSRAMEEETKSDILLARKRREANERYFKRVNEGVLDVVGKLEEVAKAMGAVERESRDIWGEEDSVIDGSVSVVSAEV